MQLKARRDPTQRHVNTPRRPRDLNLGRCACFGRRCVFRSTVAPLLAHAFFLPADDCQRAQHRSRRTFPLYEDDIKFIPTLRYMSLSTWVIADGSDSHRAPPAPLQRRSVTSLFLCLQLGACSVQHSRRARGIRCERAQTSGIAPSPPNLAT